MGLHARNRVGIGAAKRLVDIIRVGNILGSLDLVAVGVTLSENALPGHLVLLHHLNAEDVVDFNVMGTESVMQEVWWEHHVVTLEPEFWVVLRIEEVNVT